MTEIERFWSKVNKNAKNGCWEWTASLTNTYGAFMTKRKLYRANRYSYELHFGKIPLKMLVCHKCDNRLCVNPEHLFLGTYKQNTHDMVKKQRNHKPKLTNIQVNELKFIAKTTKLTQKQLGKLYNISQGMVHFILSGKQWNIGAE